MKVRRWNGKRLAQYLELEMPAQRHEDSWVISVTPPELALDGPLRLLVAAGVAL